MVFEMATSSEWHVPCKLLDYASDQGWQRRFVIYLNADFSLSVEHRQGNAVSYVRLSNIKATAHDDLRVTYSWDAPAREGLLTVENLATGMIHQAVFGDPLPVPLSDAGAIIAVQHDVQIDPRIAYAAFSDNIIPVGPNPAITAGTKVLTMNGPRPIERLALGDLVVTQGNGSQPIRWIVKTELPARGHSTPIRLRAPYFGLVEDIVVSADQRVMISGLETEYNIGRDAVLVQAKNLLGHVGAAVDTRHAFRTYYHILLDSHECLNLSGAWSESLYVGQIARSPEVVATTTLAPVPAAILPIHQSPAHPVLRPYEMQALVNSLTA
jgi:hypothetical protein